MLKWQFDFKTAFAFGFTFKGEFVITVPFIGFLTNKSRLVPSAYSYFFFKEFDIGAALTFNFVFHYRLFSIVGFVMLIRPLRWLWLKTYRIKTIQYHSTDTETLMWGKKVVYRKAEQNVLVGFLYPFKKTEGIVIVDEMGKETFSKCHTPEEQEAIMVKAHDMLSDLEKMVGNFMEQTDGMRRRK